MRCSKTSLWGLLLALIAAMFIVSASCTDGDGDGDGDGTPEATEEGTPSDGTPSDSGDLSDVPEDTTGITDTEIKLGSHMPLTGVAGIYGNAIVPGIQAYFNYINETEGGVNGRKITLIVKDDAYDPSQTNQVVRELVEQDQVFAMVSGLGTAQHSAAFEYLKEQKIPDLFVATGATKFTDPISRTTFGYNPNYVQEGTALGQYIAETYPDAKLGLLLQNDDFGEDGRKGIEAGIEGSNVEIVDAQTYEAVQTDMTAQVQNLINAGADTLAGYALPQQAGSLVKVARQTLDFQGGIIVSGVVADQLTIALMKGAPDAVGAADGTISALYLKPLESGDPGVEQHKTILAQYGPEGANPSNITIYGQSVAELVVEVLKRAGDNLNRRSVLETAESIRDFTCSVCIGPINLSPTDHRPIEAFNLGRIENDAWVPFGDLISYESTE